MEAKDFYKEMYGEDAPEKFEEMEAKILFDFAEAYAQQQIDENISDKINDK